MKMKRLSVVAKMGVFLAVTGIANAVELPSGPVLTKTLDYEVGTSYSGGAAGTFYFRNAAASYVTDEYGLLAYTGGTIRPCLVMRIPLSQTQLAPMRIAGGCSYHGN